MIPNRYPTLNFDLGETADMIRDSVQGFAQNEIAPLAAEIDKTDVFPRQLLPKMGELGLLGVTVDTNSLPADGGGEDGGDSHQRPRAGGENLS